MVLVILEGEGDEDISINFSLIEKDLYKLFNHSGLFYTHPIAISFIVASLLALLLLFSYHTCKKFKIKEKGKTKVEQKIHEEIIYPKTPTKITCNIQKNKGKTQLIEYFDFFENRILWTVLCFQIYYYF
mmetsp:Transcript_19303/g.17122  ORF Transcript_19303/g.17122 Transcript_19303/m.17122 type:complete len:129 (-) Transcript_19303:19-405(-)